MTSRAARRNEARQQSRTVVKAALSQGQRSADLASRQRIKRRVFEQIGGGGSEARSGRAGKTPILTFDNWSF